MIHLMLPFGLASILAAAGVHAILARRNAVLMLIGVELVLAAANLILVTTSAVLPDRQAAGQILAVFIITLAAAEVTLALGIILYAFRQHGHIDLGEALEADAMDDTDGATEASSAGRVTRDAETPREAEARDADAQNAVGDARTADTTASGASPAQPDTATTSPREVTP